jgi:predicted ArsR family transcriptional regulator
LAARYANSVRAELLQERVQELAEALSARGVLTEVSVETEDDVIVLHAYNCPYHDLAQDYRDICEMDEELLQKVLGSEVNLTACIMDGHHGCRFVVRNQPVVAAS